MYWKIPSCYTVYSHLVEIATEHQDIMDSTVGFELSHWLKAIELSSNTECSGQNARASQMCKIKKSSKIMR